MRHVVTYTVLVVVIVALVVFNVQTVRRVSQRPEPAEPPVLNEAPVHVYGVIEPAGKEIAVSPNRSGVVRELLAAEGDTVRAGQLLCVLDDDVERAELETAQAGLALHRKAAEISRDEFHRNEELVRNGSISESQFTLLKLKYELDEEQVALSEHERELARARLEQLTLTAPRDGIVYLCDIRPGEYFEAGDIERIVIGSTELQVRCDIEVVWIDRFLENAAYEVRNAETGDPVGTAIFASSSRYLRSKRLMTEDPREKMSARYQEIVLRFNPSKEETPIHLPVMVKLPDQRS